MNAVSSIIERAIASRAFPAAAIEVGRGDRVLWNAAFGRLRYGPDAVAATPGTIFDLASLTKVIATATLATRAVDAGLLSLDDRIAGRLPDWRGADRERVTIADLLEHCSGLTAYLPQDERHSFSRDYWLQILTHLMGGRAAEQIVLNQLTTGASDDIRRATNIARRMVCEWGMSERLGPLTFGSKEEYIFLGKEISQHRDYSEKTAIAIDEEVRSLVEGAYNRARQLLTDNVDKLHILALALLEREVLDGEEVEKVLRGEKLEPIVRDRGGDRPSPAAAPVEEPKREKAPPRVHPTESPGLA